MPLYDIKALCRDCQQFHDLLIRIKLEKAFDVWTVQDALEDGILSPTQLMPTSKLMCPQTHNEIPVDFALMVVVAVG